MSGGASEENKLLVIQKIVAAQNDYIVELETKNKELSSLLEDKRDGPKGGSLAADERRKYEITISQYRDKLERTSKELNLCKEEQRVLRGETEALKKAYEDMRAWQRGRGEGQQEMVAEHSQALLQVEELKSQIENYESKLERQRESHENEVSRWKEKEGNWVDERAKLLDMLQQEQDRESSLKSTEQQTKDALEREKARVKRLETEIERSKAELSHHKAQLEAYEKKHVEATGQSHALTTVIQRERALAKELRDRMDASIEAFRAEVAQLRKALIAREREIDELRTHLSGDVKRLQAMWAKKGEANAKEKEALQSHMDMMQKVLTQQSKLLEQQRLANESEYRTLMEAYKKKEATWLQQHHDMQLEIESLTKQLVSATSRGTEQLSSTDAALWEEKYYAALRGREEAQAMLLAEKEALHKEAEESRVKYEEEYKRMKEDLEKQVVGLKSDLEAATERETSLREELASAQARVEEIYENSEEFEKRLEEEKQLLRDSAERAAQLADERLQTATLRASDAEKRAHEARLELRQLRETTAAARQTHLQELQELQGSFEKAKAGFSVELSKLQGVISGLERELAAVQGVAKEREEALAKVTEESVKTKNSLQNALAEATSAVEAAQSDKEELEKTLNGKLKEVESQLKAVLAQASEAEQALQTRVTELEVQVKDLKAENRRQRESHSEASASAEQRFQQRLEHEKAVADDALASVREATARLEAEQDVWAEERRRLEEGLRDVQRHLRREQETLAKERNLHSEEVEALKQQLSDAREDAKQLRIHLNEADPVGTAPRGWSAAVQAWEERQNEQHSAVRALQSLIDGLRRRQDDASRQWASERAAALAELRTLRHAQSMSAETLSAGQDLWASERRRREEEAEAAQLRLQKLEEALGEKVKGLEGELEAVEKMKQSLARGGDERMRELEREIENASAELGRLQREASEADRRAHRLAEEKKSEVGRLMDLHKRQLELAANTHERREASHRAALRQMQGDYQDLKYSLDDREQQLKKAREDYKTANDTAMQELRELRALVSHLRKMEVDRDADMQREKHELLEELGRFRQGKEANEEALMAKVKQSREKWGNEMLAREKAMEEVVVEVRRQVAELHEALREKDRSHGNEVKNLQAAVGILRQMEKERERVAAEERSALNSVLERLHKQYQAMHQRNTKERIELQTEIEGLRQQLFHSHFKERGEGSAVEYPPMPAGHQLLEHSPGGATGHGTRKSPTGYPPPRSPTRAATKTEGGSRRLSGPMQGRGDQHQHAMRYAPAGLPYDSVGSDAAELPTTTRRFSMDRSQRPRVPPGSSGGRPEGARR